MFDNKDIEAYRNIKVPSELKTKILVDCEAEELRGKRVIGGAFPSQQLIRSLSAVAACFVLAVAIFSLTRMNTAPVTLSYEGTVLSHERLAVSDTASYALEARTVTPAGIPLEIRSSGRAEITVSGGELFGLGEDGEQIVSLGECTEIIGDTVVWWSVGDSSATYELRVSADGEETVYILEQNDLAPNGVIYKK